MIAFLANTGDQAAASGPGFPAFEMWHWASQAFWLILTFTVLYLVLSRTVLPRLGSTIERRGNTLASELDEAEKLNTQAREAEQALQVELARARNAARETAAQAQARMKEEIAEETRKVDEKINAKLADAEGRIAQLRDDAMSNVESVASEATESLLAQLGRRTEPDIVRSAVRSALDERQT
jgi:F-type H+-transporting ATPase subunit b